MREVLEVRIRQGGGWFIPCLIFFAVIAYWKWVLLVVGLLSALFLLAWAIRVLHRDARDQRALVEAQAEAERRRRERLARNAEAENALFHAGDPRGIYGMDYADGKEPGR